MKSILKSLTEAQDVLSGFISDNSKLEKVREAADLMTDSISKGGKIISFGNGGSMSDAIHFAEEMTGRFRDDRPPLPAIAIADPSHITCVANDYGFDAIFSRFIESIGKAGDIALAISTSGNSANVVNAAKTARNKQMKVIALTGRDGGLLAKHSDIEIRIPHFEYSDRIQEMHIKILHILVQLVEKGK